MSNVKILEIILEDYETAYVEAVVDDMILTHMQTMLDPEEYGPAKCCAFVDLSDVSEYVSDIGLGIHMENPIEAVKEYLEAIDYDVNWEICDRDDY